MNNNAEQFQKRFTGNQRVHGILDANGNYKTVKGQPTLELHQQHLTGQCSLGIVPITDKGNCKMGALDFDDHKKDKNNIKKFDYNKLLEKIKFLNLPLVVCKSKSGGAHAYLFLDTYYKAGDIRHILKKFVYALGYERNSVEIFPKQETLLNEDGTLGDGNFINLPYHKGNTRVMLDVDGSSLKLEEALLYSPKRVTDGDNLSKFKLLDHGKPQHRNDRTFAYGSFAKKHYPNEWKQKIKDYNQLFNDPPLGDAIKDKSTRLEDTIIKSLTKKDYHQNIEEDAPTELVGYDISEYRNLEIKKPVFITERLFKENSINFLVGPKGKGKTELSLGFANAMARGLPILNYENPVCNPVLYIDGEMDQYDIIERDDPYLETFGKPPKNYLHVINWSFQKNQNIPDIREPVGQKLILQYLQKQENLTGKKPFVILDNLIC